MKKAVLVLFSLIVAAAVAFASDIKVNSNLKSGDKIGGRVTLRVTVESSMPVNQVEFYHKGRLLRTATSTPYMLEINTLVEDEGPYDVEVAVYLTDGESKRETLRLVIDNNLGLGAAAHTENARRFLQSGNYGGAIQAGLVALKCDEHYVPAKIVVARAYYEKGDFAEAQTFGESALASGDNVEAYELLSAVFAKRAFRLLALGENRAQAMEQITQSLISSVRNKRKAVEMEIKAAGAITDANLYAVLGLHIKNNDFSIVARLMRERYNQFDPDTRVANFLIHSLMRQGKIKEAVEVVHQVTKNGAPDETTFALMTAAYAYYRNFEKADESLRNATLAAADGDPLVMTAAAFVAIKKGDRRAMQSQVQDMVRKSILVPEALFYLSVLQYYTSDLMAARDSYERTVVSNPLLYDIYIQEGYASLGKSIRTQESELLPLQAAGYMRVALEAMPDSPEALNGLAIVSLFQGKNEDGLKWAEAAVRAGPEYAWTWYTYSCALDRARKTVEANNAIKRAGELDPEILKGRAIATIEEAWTYTVTHGRIATLVPPK